MFVAIGQMATSWAGRVLMGAIILHDLRRWEVLDVRDTFGGVWHILTRSEPHGWLSSEERLDRQYKRERQPCLYRPQNLRYSLNPKRETDRPTAERLLEAFQDITLTIIKGPHQTDRHVTALRPLQQQILEILGFSSALYTRLGTISSEPP